MGSLCSKDDAATPATRSAEPVCLFFGIRVVNLSVTPLTELCLLAQYKGGEPRRSVEAEGSDSGKSFSELYRLGKQVSFRESLVA